MENLRDKLAPCSKSVTFFRTAFPMFLCALTFVFSAPFGRNALAEEIHPEAFVGKVIFRGGTEVELNVEQNIVFSREEELLVYEKRESIQIAGVTVKINWARIGKIRIVTSEGGWAKAEVVDEYSGSSIATGNEVGKLPNTPPEIISITAENTMLKPRHETSMFIDAKDNEGDCLQYTAKASGGDLIGLFGNSPVLQWIAPETPGSYEVTIIVTDAKGAGSKKTLPMTVSPVPETSPYSLVQTYGGSARSFLPFKQVNDIQIDRTGNLWALDGKERLLRVISPTGDDVAIVTLSGSESAFGLSPSRLCLDGKNGAYILDIPHRTLSHTDANGKSARMVFDRSTCENFLLKDPCDFVCTKEGDILITDPESGHIVAIDEYGNFRLLFGSQGMRTDQLMRPVSVAVNQYGDIFVLDSANQKIVQFDRLFRFRASHNCPMEGQVAEIISDPRDQSFLVLDCKTGSVRKFSASGPLEVVVGGLVGGGSSSPTATSIALNSNGNILIGTDNASIWEFSAKGVLSGTFGEEQFEDVIDIAANDEGTLFALDKSLAQVKRFDRHGWLRGFFGGRGEYEGTFLSPERICFDNQDNTYIFDNKKECIQRFTPSGAFDKILPVDSDLADGLHDIAYMTLRNEKIYLLDEKRSSVYSLSLEGKLERIIPLILPDPRLSKRFKPAHLAVDESGAIYISDPRAYALYKFDGNGKFLQEIGGKGKDPGKFGKIGDIAVDSRGLLYVLLKDRENISSFNATGTFRMEIPLTVKEDTSLRKAESFAVDSFGALYVYDDYFKTVFKFMQ